MKKGTGKATTMPVGLAKGQGVSLLITLLGSIVIAKLLEKELIQWRNVGYGIMCILMLASFAGTAIACARIKRLRIQVCACSAIIYWAFLLMINVVFFGGNFEAVWVTLLLIVAGSACAGLIATRKRNKSSGIKRRTYLLS